MEPWNRSLGHCSPLGPRGLVLCLPRERWLKTCGTRGCKCRWGGEGGVHFALCQGSRWICWPFLVWCDYIEGISRARDRGTPSLILPFIAKQVTNQRDMMTFSNCYPNQSTATTFNLTMENIFLPLKPLSLLLGWAICFSFLSFLLFPLFILSFIQWSVLFHLNKTHFTVQHLELLNAQDIGYWF